MKETSSGLELDTQPEKEVQANQNWKTRLWRARLDQGWQWLIYLDFILPALLFLLAWLPLSMRTFFAQLYHQYNLFVLKPIPNLHSFTGIVGLILHLVLIVRALIRRQWIDLVLCLLFFLIVMLFFVVRIDGVALNYWLIRFLDFGVSTR